MGRILTVNFRKDTLYAFDNDDGTFVALKPIVEGMGLDWSAQLKRVKRDAILSEGMAIMATPFGRGGGRTDFRHEGSAAVDGTPWRPGRL